MNALQMLRINLETPTLGKAPTLAAVAQELGMSPGNLSSVERGEVRVGVRSLLRLSELYGVPTETIDRLWEEARLDFLRSQIAALEARAKARKAAARAAGRKAKGSRK